MILHISFETYIVKDVYYQIPFNNLLYFSSRKNIHKRVSSTRRIKKGHGFIHPSAWHVIKTKWNVYDARGQSRSSNRSMNLRRRDWREKKKSSPFCGSLSRNSFDRSIIEPAMIEWTNRDEREENGIEISRWPSLTSIIGNKRGR